MWAPAASGERSTYSENDENLVPGWH